MKSLHVSRLVVRESTAKEAHMFGGLFRGVHILFGVVVATLAVLLAQTTAVVAQPAPAQQAAAVQGLLKRTDLPPDFRPVAALAGRGQFYAAGARGLQARRWG
jgi:hypothetical protein